MKARLLLAAVGMSALLSTGAYADLTEGFDDIETLVPAGWYMQNNSEPLGVLDWFQGNDTVFPSHEGDPTSYLAGNYNSSGSPGTISNWLLTPEMTLNNGDTISFWTRTVEASGWADRLQLRLSTNGGSTDVGTGAFDVGDFTTLLLDINPNYELGGVYPEEWTQFTVTLSGLGGPTDGRVALRYFVEDSGPSGVNSNYIGIDTFSYTVPAPGVLALLGLAGLVSRRRR